MIAEPQTEAVATVPAAAPQMGRIAGEASAVYHATHAISASKLRAFARRPGGAQLYYQKYIAKTLPAADSEALVFGRALHCLTLEGREVFEREFITPSADAPKRPTKAMLTAKKPSPESLECIRWWADFDAASNGREIITAQMLREVEAMAGNIHGHPVAEVLLAAGEPEITWRLNASGLAHCPPLQVRTDWFCEQGCELSKGRPFVLDIKTCATLEEGAFGGWQRGFEEHGYHRQAAFYMAVLGALGVLCHDFFFVAAEKCAPGGVQVCRLSDRALEQGQREVDLMLNDINECYRRNWWPNASLELEEIDLSHFYYARANEKVKEVDFS